MKKVLTILLIISILMSLSVSIVLAEGSKNNNPNNGSNTSSSTQNNQEQAKATMNQYMARFEENRLDATALKTQTRSQLKTQAEMTDECKLQLREMNQAYLLMTEEERLAHQEEIDALRSQIREAHRYSLQIKLATATQTRSRLQDCVPSGTPTETEIEGTSQILDEL